MLGDRDNWKNWAHHFVDKLTAKVQKNQQLHMSFDMNQQVHNYNILDPTNQILEPLLQKNYKNMKQFQLLKIYMYNQKFQGLVI